MRGIRRGLDQNSCPRGGDLEQVCNTESKYYEKFNGEGRLLNLQFATRWGF